MPLTVATGLGFASGVSLWFWYPRFGHVLGPYFAGATTGMAMWIWDDPPEYIVRWKRGADGERRTERALQRLTGSNWNAFHDRQGGRGNLDHVVVGPGGVFLLDSKNLSGTVTLEAEGLTTKFADAERNAFTYTQLGNAMRGLAVRLKEELEEQTRLTPWVQAVVVVWGEFAQEPVEQHNVVYLHGERLAAWLSERPNRLSPRNQSFIELAVKAGLVAPPFVAPEPAV
jgi:hypothetical protein